MYNWNLFNKIKKILILDSISNKFNLTRFVFSFDFTESILCVFISTIIWLNKKFILINKVNQHNWVNSPYYDIKYLDLHPTLDFSKYVFSYRLFFFYWHRWFLIFLIKCVNNVFYLHLIFSLFKITCWKSFHV